MMAERDILPKTLAIFAVLVLTIAGLFYVDRILRPALFTTELVPVGVGGETSMGGEGFPRSRADYELHRIRDPYTGKIPAHYRDLELATARSLPNDAATGFMKTSAALSWSHRGPWNVGGRTRAFGIDVNDENRFIAGSVSGGLWRSSDGGQTWTMSAGTTDHHGTTCLVQDRRSGKTSTWYAGTGEAYGQSASASGAYYLGYGIYKSTDNGQTWAALPSTRPGSPTSFDTDFDLLWNMAVDSSNAAEDEVYAATYGGVYRSTDGGTTWTEVLTTASTDPYYTDVAITSDGILYATCSDDGGAFRGIWRSEDGLAWTNITPDSFAVAYDRIVIGIAPSNENVVYFLGNTPGYGMLTADSARNRFDWTSLWRYTYLSGDGTDTGGAWVDLSMNLPDDGTYFDKIVTQNSYDLVVKVKPDDENVVFVGGTNLYRSTDGFTSDTNTVKIGGYEIGADRPVVNSYPNNHPDHHTVTFFPSDPGKMVNTSDGGVFVTANVMDPVVTWTSLNNGYLTTQFYTVEVDRGDTASDVIIGGTQDNGTWFTATAAPTSPWTHSWGGDGSYCAIGNSTDYYFSKQEGKIYRAKVDAAGNPTSYARIDPAGAGDYLFIHPFALDPNDNNVMYLPIERTIWRNSDLSAIPLNNTHDSISLNWSMLNDTIPIAGLTITAIAVSQNSPANRLYLGTNKRRMFRVDSAHTAVPVLTDITSFFFPGGNANISSIAIDPRNGDNVMVAFSNYGAYSIFYSRDAGTTFERAAGNLESGFGPSVRWVSILPVGSKTAFLAGTSVGLYATDTLEGINTTWVQLGTAEIGKVVVDMIATRPEDGFVAVGTHANGIFSTHITDISQIVGIKEAFMDGAPVMGLSCYPNPARDRTSFRFTTHEKLQVKLSVYNGSGQRVAVLINGELPAGTHTVPFSTDGLARGLYYYSVESGDYRRAAKLIVH